MDEWGFEASASLDAVGPPVGASLDEVLSSGGDERIEISPETGLNRYGGAVRPLLDGIAFSSSTVSTISTGAFAAAEARREALLAEHDPAAAYVREIEAVRRRLVALCGLPPAQADDIVLGASGTDLHLFAAALARSDARSPFVAVLPDPAESGRGVPLALRGVRHSAQPPFGAPGATGEPLPGLAPGRLCTIGLRDAFGAPRDPALVDRDVERACAAAVAEGAPVLLTLLDVSKTGLIAPSPECACRLKERHGERLTVLVDACQFRLSGASLRWYLAQNFLVAVTGSKFFGGPPFSGALFVPEASAGRLRAVELPAAVADYSARADWPTAYAGRSGLREVQNWGLLLRWEAALHEFEAFERLPSEEVAAFLAEFRDALTSHLARLSALESVAAPALERPAAQSWELIPTIFPFLVRGPGGVLAAAETQALFERLRAAGVRLGQPAPVARRGHEVVCALRLSIGGREVVEALESPAGRAAVIARARNALELADRAAADLAG